MICAHCLTEDWCVCEVAEQASLPEPSETAEATSVEPEDADQEEEEYSSYCQAVGGCGIDGCGECAYMWRTSRY